MVKYYACVDVGTTAIKAGIVESKNFTAIRKISQKAEVIHPRKGFAEIDPDKLLDQVTSLLSIISEDYEINGIGITAHMAGFVPVDRNGNALYNMVIWLDERGKDYPKKLFRGALKISGYNLFELLRFLRITGGAPSRTGKDVLSKILWLRDNEPEIFSKTWKFLDVKGYLIFRMTGKTVTSPDEANLTWLADTRKGNVKWHKGLMKRYGLNESLFPEIKNSTDIVGNLNGEFSKEVGKKHVPVVVGAGDMSTSAIGSGAVKDGKIHIYIGTSDWIGAHVSRRMADIRHYIGTIFSGVPGKYLIVAEQEIAGGAIDWLLGILGENHEKVDELISDVETDLLFTPWFFGERAPVDDHYVRGSIINIGIESDRKDIMRALMEGIALNIAWAYSYVEKMAGKNETVNITGGGSRFESLVRLISSAINRKIARTYSPEDSGIRGVGVIVNSAVTGESIESCAERFRYDREFTPVQELSKRLEMKLQILKRYYRSTRKIFRELNSI